VGLPGDWLLKGESAASLQSTKRRGSEQMKASARYAKIVEWSDEDHCYVGSAPGIILGGCHGDDEQVVFKELCEIVEETLRFMRETGSLFHHRRRVAISRTACKVSPKNPGRYANQRPSHSEQ
jgi:hypothetical protein